MEGVEVFSMEGPGWAMKVLGEILLSLSPPTLVRSAHLNYCHLLRQSPQSSVTPLWPFNACSF